MVVSEETGLISVANGGKLIRHLDEKQLREMLSTELTHNGGLLNRKTEGGRANG